MAKRIFFNLLQLIFYGWIINAIHAASPTAIFAVAVFLAWTFIGGGGER